MSTIAGNVKLRPELLESHQAYVKEQLKSENDKPVFLVFHGGSGSTKSEITTAVKAGVVKMNVDTDTQWAYMVGFRDYFKAKKDYLDTQVGNQRERTSLTRSTTTQEFGFVREKRQWSSVSRRQ